MTPDKQRTLLVRTASAASRESVYASADGFELETSDYDVSRRRVLYSDVVLVTFHRRIGLTFVLVNLGFVLFFVTMAAVMYSVIPQNDREAGWIFASVFGSFASPFVVAILIRLVMRVDVITIHGKRSNAEMAFTFRKTRARELYEEIVDRVTTEQERLRRQYAADAAAAQAAAPAPAPPAGGDDAPPMPPTLP